ncbi:hypothetical protein [Pseudoalteromonas ulvae]|nr:hypothetical protein [Pseudoalteromonas ulvae]
MDALNISTPLLNEILDNLVRTRVESLPKSETLPKRVYCEHYQTTAEAIRKRLSTGVWQMGVHVLKVDGAGEFIDLRAVDAWVRKQGKSCHAA